MLYKELCGSHGKFSCYENINFLLNGSTTPQSSKCWMNRISLYLEAGSLSNDKQLKWDHFMIRMQPVCSLAVCHICYCVLFLSLPVSSQALSVSVTAKSGEQ